MTITMIAVSKQVIDNPHPMYVTMDRAVLSVVFYNSIIIISVVNKSGNVHS